MSLSKEQTKYFETTLEVSRRQIEEINEQIAQYNPTPSIVSFPAIPARNSSGEKSTRLTFGPFIAGQPNAPGMPNPHP